MRGRETSGRGAAGVFLPARSRFKGDEPLGPR